MAKKVDDVTKQPQALTDEDVNAQDSRTRLWQSLDQTYGERATDTAKQYDQSISAAGRAAQQRGMGRSSYALQTMANLGNEKATALDRISQEQIADYQNRLTNLEQQERAEQFQREQFEYQKERNEVADQQWNQQFGYQKERDAISDAFQREQLDTSKNQWNLQFEYGKERDKVSDAFQRESFDYSKERDKISDAFQRESFDQQNKNTQQQVAIQYLNQMLQQGGTPSDDLLKQAGISREDYNQMKQKKQTVVYAKKPTEKSGTPNPGETYGSFINDLDNGGTPQGQAIYQSDLYINGKKQKK